VAETLQLLLNAFKAPDAVLHWSAAEWTAAFSMARRELVLGHLAAELEAAELTLKLPERAQTQLQDGLRFAAHSHLQARHDALYFAQILKPLECPIVVLKGSAYVLADQPASAGRQAGDLDVLVPRSWLAAVEKCLAEHGWNVAHKSDYDDQYYRNYMHELPPIVHNDKSCVLDLHHSILPMTSRLAPNPTELLAAAQDVENTEFGTGLKILSREDQILHSATHLFYDGDLTGGLRNLHDVHRLIRVCAHNPIFWSTLIARAKLHQLNLPLFYALRYAHMYLNTPVPADIMQQLKRMMPFSSIIWLMDFLVHIRLAKATVGQHSLQVRTTTFLLYLRSHWLRMPAIMLAKHLWTKFRMKGAL
jgi:Uncharacterised nucleotidyltransferase